MSHKAHHTVSKHVAFFTTFVIKQFEGLYPWRPFSLHPPTYTKGGTSGTCHPITCCIGTPTHHLVLPWAESPGWILGAQAADRGQYLLLLPKIFLLKREGKNIKMLLITNNIWSTSFKSSRVSGKRPIDFREIWFRI